MLYAVDQAANPLLPQELRQHIGNTCRARLKLKGSVLTPRPRLHLLGTRHTCEFLSGHLAVQLQAVCLAAV